MAPGPAAGMTAVPAREHIYLSSVLWDGLWIIQQPICNEIQKQEPVLFVERVASLFTVLPPLPVTWPDPLTSCGFVPVPRLTIPVAALQ